MNISSETFKNLLRRAYFGAKDCRLLRALARLRALAAIKRRMFEYLQRPRPRQRQWLQAQIQARRDRYRPKNEPGLLSFITTVWNTPPEFLKPLAQGLMAQAGKLDFEWVLLDNGSTSAATREALDRIVSRYPAIRFHRVLKNLGIIGGMRFCLERATGRYALPLDSDDLLTSDCVSIVTAAIQSLHYPPLLYTDEDKIQQDRHLLEFFKNDWDGVFFVHCCFIAHLNAFDRKRALELGVYRDARAEGCHDWDTFFRFWAAGHTPAHVSEIVYSWRMHEQSCAQNIFSKSYIHDSQRHVLEQFLRRQDRPDLYRLEYSPLFAGTPDWWILRAHRDERPLLSIVLGDGPLTPESIHRSCQYPRHQAIRLHLTATPADLLPHAKRMAAEGGLICLASAQVEILEPEWPWEALTLMEIFSDTTVVGGRIIEPNDLILEAPRVLGFGDGCGCPDRGRHVGDPGYFASMWKQHSVSAVSAQFCVMDAAFLLAVLQKACPPDTSPVMLGQWAGAWALRSRRRVVYTPFLRARTRQDWQAMASDDQRRGFLRANRDLMPDNRYYSHWLSLDEHAPYAPATPAQRSQHLERLLAGV